MNPKSHQVLVFQVTTTTLQHFLTAITFGKNIHERVKKKILNAPSLIGKAHFQPLPFDRALIEETAELESRVEE